MQEDSEMELGRVKRKEVEYYEERKKTGSLSEEEKHSKGERGEKS